MATNAVTAYLALGSNLGNRAGRLRAALEGLAATPGITVTAVSSFMQTKPVGGPSGQGDYLNAVARVETSLAPRALLARCLEIEQAQGRRRSERWAARTLDIDILLYGDMAIREDGLIVPHPRLRERWFVLAPLAEIAAANMILPPDGMTLEDVLNAFHREEPRAACRQSV